MTRARTSTESFGFSTTSALPRQRFEAWEQAIARSHFDWSLRPRREAGPAVYRGTLRQLGIGECRVIECACDALAGTRSAREVARMTEPCFGVVYVHAGRESIRAPGLDMRLSSGAFALWDSEATMSFDAPASLQIRTSTRGPSRGRSGSRSVRFTPGSTSMATAYRAGSCTAGSPAPGTTCETIASRRSPRSRSAGASTTPPTSLAPSAACTA